MLTEKPWKLDPVLVLGLGLMTSMAFGNSVAWLLRRGQEESFVALVIGTLSFHGVLLVLTGLFLRAHRIRWSEAFGFQAPRAERALLLAFGVAILLLPITWLLGFFSAKLMTWIHLDPVAQQAVTTLQQTVQVGPRLYLGFFAIVLAPVAEEILFRGIVYPFLKTGLGGNAFPGIAFRIRARLYPWVLQKIGRRPALWTRGILCRQLRQPWPIQAALVTSLLFGVIHLNLMTFVPLTVLGIALVWLYEVTGNLLAPILAHSLFNLANFFLLVVVQMTP
jgi:membrane protease YdiL (CAAX protease family)